jgi:hypothetical protein
MNRTASLLTQVVTLAVAAGCERTLTEPELASSRGSSPAVTHDVGVEIATFFDACLSRGKLSTVSDIGTIATPQVSCRGGQSEPVVIRSGPDLYFCYKPAGDITDFSTEVPTCRTGYIIGNFAVGTDLYGCVDRGKLTSVGDTVPQCRKGYVVGLSTTAPVT